MDAFNFFLSMNFEATERIENYMQDNSDVNEITSIFMSLRPTIIAVFIYALMDKEKLNHWFSVIYALGIIIGNLFDNAIEGVRNLPDEQRQIDFSIQNPNGIFRIEILNPYEGERRKIEHHYLTTKKENTEMHGLGLMSVQKIVEKYDGLIEISDEDNVFRGVVTFYDEEVKDSAGT